MSSLRSSRGHSSISVDRIRLVNSEPGMLTVGDNGIVGSTAAVSLDDLVVSGEATINTANISVANVTTLNTAAVATTDVSANTLRISGSGNIASLSVSDISGSTAMFEDVSAGTLHAFSITTSDAYPDASINTRGGNILCGAVLAESITAQSAQISGPISCSNATVNGTLITNSIQGPSYSYTINSSGAKFYSLECVTSPSIQNSGTIRANNISSNTISTGVINVGGTTPNAGTINAINIASSRLTVSGNGTTTGIITAHTINATNNLTTPKLTVSGNGTTTGIITAPAIYATSSINVAGNGTTTGIITAPAINATNNLTTPKLTVSGDGTTTGIITAPSINVTTIGPYDVSGSCVLTGAVTINNERTNDPSNTTILRVVQSDMSGTGAAMFYYVGENSNGFGDTVNDSEEFCLYTYQKPNIANPRKVESTPVKTSTIGPSGLTGSIGDKYFYGNVQVGGYVAAQDGIFRSNVGIGVGSAVHALDVNGQVNISGSGPAVQEFTSPGIYTIRISENIESLTFELVGGGGAGSGANNDGGGAGGYFKGELVIDPAYVGETLTIKVGDIGQASYLSFIDAQDTIVIAGGGGGAGQTALGGTKTSLKGGYGGGGTEISVGSGVYAGGNGTNTLSNITSNAVGGSTLGGAGAQNPFFNMNGVKGSDPSSTIYTDVPGGEPANGGAGGSGYAGGGSGTYAEQDVTGSGDRTIESSSGAGGSSFVKNGINIISTKNGSDFESTTGLLPNYGRSGKGGYVSISYTSSLPSLYTSNDIACGGKLALLGAAPTEKISPGTPGQIAVDATYLYVCTAQNNWGRIAIDNNTAW